MRDFLVSGTMPFILVMSVYFLVRFVMYLLPSKSKGTFLFKAQWHFKKPWLIVPTVVLVVVYTGFGLCFSADKIADSGLERILQWCLLCLPILWVVLMFLPEKIYTNGVSDITHFDMWREIARVEPIGENAYKIVQRRGVKYKLYLHEGDRLPVNLTIPDDIGTEAFKH